ncbi:hypothetical protein B0H11DRAFT_2190806 [Mycena galericulata]|nr:hypothetical protein B0H11DRAFT_2190806 [Mycena galericulata]
MQKGPIRAEKLLVSGFPFGEKFRSHASSPPLPSPLSCLEVEIPRNPTLHKPLGFGPLRVPPRAVLRGRGGPCGASCAGAGADIGVSDIALGAPAAAGNRRWREGVCGVCDGVDVGLPAGVCVAGARACICVDVVRVPRISQPTLPHTRITPRPMTTTNPSTHTTPTSASTNLGKEERVGTLRREVVLEEVGSSSAASDEDEDETPFARRARETGRVYRGGKNDVADISVVVAVIAPAHSHGPGALAAARAAGG